MKKILYTLICGTVLCCAACRKYVEIPPENLKVLSATSDYQALLNYGITFEVSYSSPVLSSDDMGTDEVVWQNPLNVLSANAYTWADRMYEAAAEDNEWSKFYNTIFNCNVVINGVMDSQGGTDQQKRRALAEALVHRAYSYFTLVNMYAKQYDPATAATDPGLPLVLTPRFTTDLTRVSVQKIYNQIKADLNAALPDLADRADFITNPSKTAVYALLARTYLNTREFSEAQRNSELALSLQNTLIDLKAYTAPNVTFPNRLTNPEEIFFKRTASYLPNVPINANTISIYDLNDLRYQLYTADRTKSNAPFNNRVFYKHRLSVDGAYVGPSVPEMMLIKAECEARADKPDAAINTLNELRKKRFDDAHYVGLTASTGNEALHRVIDERTREFIGRGFRWFDQRRLRQDPGFITTVTRVFKDVTYTLTPESNRYTYRIAEKYIQLNPEIVQNPR
ncbi:RagB/SusD family nutrient uptake outer membrane protein [Pedobacter hiemivivus]|uniref:RagB/SusD family nutrient uptake outer membrane protein n=1 Tax=Pedobacter hiemivivus TaxID=2530454 RepID=A0A4R0MVJ8_9SPHI|nr:RagB/SusD family nutrient uptake outer membrane protein [Pedobacter hiemivivus]TCC89954.1 RagB/SusD family nutrient uptake outer membrane protein [Pedobacter hiemivivus]